jgi:hypothetical protein
MQRRLINPDVQLKPRRLTVVPDAKSRQRRSGVRYELRLPVIFHWNDGAEHTEGGFTSNIAINGALIRSAKCPAVGSAVHIEILLRSPDENVDELRIQCDAKVAHIVNQNGFTCFGVAWGLNDAHITCHIRKLSSSVTEQQPPGSNYD